MTELKMRFTMRLVPRDGCILAQGHTDNFRSFPLLLSLLQS